MLDEFPKPNRLPQAVRDASDALARQAHCGRGSPRAARAPARALTSRHQISPLPPGTVRRPRSTVAKNPQHTDAVPKFSATPLTC